LLFNIFAVSLFVKPQRYAGVFNLWRLLNTSGVNIKIFSAKVKFETELLNLPAIKQVFNVLLKVYKKASTTI